MSQPKLIQVHNAGSCRRVVFSPKHINEMSVARKVTWELTEFMEDRYGDSVDPVEDCGDRRLEIDMSVIDFLSSVGLNELININRQAKIRGIEIVLVGAQDQVRDIFVLTRLERMFKFQDARSTSELPKVDSTVRVS